MDSASPGGSSLSRRRLLGVAAGGAVVVTGAAALVEAGVVPGRSRLRAMLGGCGEPGAVPPVEPGPSVEGTFRSQKRNTGVRYRLSYPPGSRPGAAIPVVLALHGRSGSYAWPVEALHLDRFLAAVTPHDGGHPFAVVAVDGGDAVNWHPRADGDDPLAMLTEEIVPLAADRGLFVDRLGVLGWSLGGAGAILLASRLGPRCAALVASSPAIWTGVAATAAGTYDGPADFERFRVDRLGPALAGVPTWIDCGDLDPFAGAVDAFSATCVPAPAGGIVPGCHDERFWTRQLPGQLRFLSRHLR